MVYFFCICRLNNYLIPLVLVLSPAIASTNIVKTNVSVNKSVNFMNKFEKTYKIKEYKSFKNEFNKKFKFISKK